MDCYKKISKEEFWDLLETISDREVVVESGMICALYKLNVGAECFDLLNNCGDIVCSACVSDIKECCMKKSPVGLTLMLVDKYDNTLVIK
jgi:hypothetical protein